MSTDSHADRRARWILLGLTVLGGLLRFAGLGHPCLWGDEALVYWRTCGTYGQLLQPLHADGFPPLHYELFWVIVHALGHTPGPAAMRAVAATCGTLTVPAVYLLARQLLPRRASLTAAAFTAGSAFALFYSRDAKMYAEAWLAMTLSVACLLWWVRTGRSTAWLGWVAAGAAAGGFQTLTLVSVIGLTPLVLLTQRRAHWRQTLLCLCGIVLIVAGPVGYYARFNGWAENVDDRGWAASGLGWVRWYNAGRSGPDQARYLATTFLTGWEWPRLESTPGPAWWLPPAPPGPAAVHWRVSFVGMPLRRAWAFTSMALAVFLVLAAGLLPWGAVQRWTGTTTAADDGPEPPWRAALWLSAWVALPVYGFYGRSVEGFALPADVLGIGRHPQAWVGLTACFGVVVGVGACFAVTRSLAVRWLQLAIVFAGVVGACQGLGMGMASAARAAAAAGRAWESVWVPRYLGFVWPAVAVVVGVLLDRLPTRASRAAGLAVVLGANLWMFGFRQFGSTEPPVDRMAADVWAAQPAADGHPSRVLAWTPLLDHARFQTGPGAGNLFSDPGRYYLQLQAGRPMSPTLFKRSLDTFVLHRGDLAAVAHAVGPAVRRVVVWEQFEDPPAAADVVLPTLPHWQRTADELFPVRDVWTGRDLSWYRRREYRRPA